MHAHPVETSQTHTNSGRAVPLAVGTAVSPVGTFAAGQSDHGSIHVAADANVGSFASGLRETAGSVAA